MDPERPLRRTENGVGYRFAVGVVGCDARWAWAGRNVWMWAGHVPCAEPGGAAVVRDGSRRPRQWLHQVNTPMSEAELAALRTAAQRCRPYGEPTWVERMATRYGLASPLRRPGRPAGGEKSVTSPFPSPTAELIESYGKNISQDRTKASEISR